MPSHTHSPLISAATPADVPVILELIRALAEYEKLSHEVFATEDLLREHLFGPRPVAEARVAKIDGRGVGYALFFHNFSTFLGLPGIYLEDIFVLAEFRGRGIGKALLKEVAQVAFERKCGRLEWAVLDWNQQSIRFYESLGAKPHSGWSIYGMNGDTIARFAQS